MLEEPGSHNANDEQVLCRMDVDGMPQRSLAWNLIRQRRKDASTWHTSHPGQLTRSEARKYIRYSVLAGISVVLVYSVALVLFILFCIHIWFP